MIDRANDRNVALRIEDADLFDRAEVSAVYHQVHRQLWHIGEGDHRL